MLFKNIITLTCVSLFATTAYGMEYYGTIGEDMQEVPEITCLTRAMECLQLTYHPVEISDQDYAFAQTLRPILADLSNFGNLDTKQKQEVAEAFLKNIGWLFKLDAGCLPNRFDITLGLGMQWQNLLDQFGTNPDAICYLQNIYNTIVQNNDAIPGATTKALMINFIIACQGQDSAWSQDTLKDYSLIDLAEILNEQCMRETLPWTKREMAVMGAKWPELLGAQRVWAVVVGGMGALLGSFCGIPLGPEGIGGLSTGFSVLAFFVYAIYNVISHQEQARYKPVSCTIF